MKKKVRKQQGFHNKLLLLFLLIVAIFIVEFGLNNKDLLITENEITGAQTFDIGNSIRNALDIFASVLTPLFEAIGEDQNAIFLRVFYWLFLFFIISGVEGLRKRFGADESGVKRANIIAGLVALIAVIFTPVEFLLLIGNSIFLFVFIGLILGGLYFIYNFGRGEENRFTYFIKAFLSFILLILISASSSYALNQFSGAIGIGPIFDTVAGLGIAVSVIFIFWYLLVKALIGGPSEAVETAPPGRHLREAGGFYGRGARTVGRGLGKLFSRREPRREPRGERPQERAEEARDENQIRELRNRINNALRQLSVLERDVFNLRNFTALIASMVRVVEIRIRGINFNNFIRAGTTLNNVYRNQNRMDPNTFNNRVIRVTRILRGELASLLRQLR